MRNVIQLLENPGIIIRGKALLTCMLLFKVHPR